jgi:hypothetical protein
MPRSGPTISHAYWGLGSSGSLSSHDYTALIDAAAHGLHTLPQVRLKRLPRMANFALWATACESAFGPAGTLEAAYSNNRLDVIESIVDADLVAARAREILPDRAQWTGSSSDLLLAGANVAGNPRLGTGLAGQRPPLSLGACAGHKPSCAHWGLRLSSAARAGWDNNDNGHR